MPKMRLLPVLNHHFIRGKTCNNRMTWNDLLSGHWHVILDHNYSDMPLLLIRLRPLLSLLSHEWTFTNLQFPSANFDFDRLYDPRLCNLVEVACSKISYFRADCLDCQGCRFSKSGGVGPGSHSRFDRKSVKFTKQKWNWMQIDQIRIQKGTNNVTMSRRRSMMPPPLTPGFTAGEDFAFSAPADSPKGVMTRFTSWLTFKFSS